MKKGFLIVLSAILLITSFLFTACDSWMQDDDFYADIENDVKVANAAAVNAYVRYANSKMGTTEPSGSISKKVDVPFSVSAVTNDDYGFVKWVAFSTNDFPTNQQHTSLVYESAQAYARDFKGKELSSGFVSFTDPTNPITDVNIYAERDDIFIMPLVAKRPTVVTSVPSNGRTDVVKNSQVRILFSKPIDENSLTDEFGNSNIQVTSGRAVLTENSDDMSALDITEYFNFKLSKTKKMLTISAKKNSAGVAVYKFDNNAQISVTLFEDLKDSDGFSMNGSYKFSFTTGTKEDSLAPRIDDLTAGIGQECLNYQQYKYNVSSTNYTQLAETATNTLSTYVSEDETLAAAGKVPVLTQRVKDKLNIFVRATDIAGAGAAVNLGTDNQSENDVALVQVRACLYVDKDGNPVTTSADAFADGSIGTDTSNILYIREYGYSLGMKDSDCQVNGAFETVTATLPDTAHPGQLLPNTSGTLFTYDLSRLDDGLVKIDIWAVDMVGNSGDEEAYAGTYNNGYRSIFVVKDSTAPDAATEVSKVITESGSDTNGVAAPYEWYNVSSLSKLQVKDQTGSSNLIHDASNEFLRSKDNKLKWIFKVGNDTSWVPSPSAAGWTDIHNDSNQPIVRTLSDAVSSADGPVAVTMCLMDDLGNVSSPVLLQSIMYDNTAPVLTPTVSWVQNTSTTAGTYAYSYIVSTTDKANLSESGHILKVPFTEEWAGLRRIKVTVQKDGSGTAVPQGNYTIRYVPASGSARDLSFDSSAGTSDYKIFDVNDTNPVKTGNLYISGIKIGNENGGSYRVTVDLWDSSLNHSVTHSDISIDTTAPELKKVYIPGLKQSINATSSGFEVTSDDGWILPREYVKGPEGQSSNSSTSPAYIPLYLFVKEADSGVHKISFASADDVKLFNDTSKKTTLYKIEKFGQTDEVRTLVPESDYTIDTSAKTITLVDNPTVKLSSSNENGFVILVKDIGFKSYISGENKIDVTVTDLATLSGNNNKLSPYTSGSTEITGVKADSYLSASTPAYTLKDRGASAGSLATESGYTNEAIINVEISVGADSGSSAKSGYNSFKLSGAKFIPGQTEVLIGSTSITYQLSDNNTVLTLRHKEGTDFAETDKYIVLRDKTFTIKNIQLDDSISDGVKSLSITTYDLAGWNHTATTKTITLDTTPPELLKVPFTAVYTNSTTGYDSAKTVYPHADGENGSGSLINGLATFYTSKGYTDSSKSVVIGIRAKDATALWGTTNGTSNFLKCMVGDKTKDEVIAGTSTSLTLVSYGQDNTAQNSVLHFNFIAGNTYSAIIVDKAGNCSDVFTFKVQEDTTAPVMKDSANKSLNEYVYMEAPDAGSSIYKNEIDSFSDRNEFIYAIDSSSTDPIRTKKYVTKKSSGKYKIIFNLASEKYVATNEVTRLINGTEPASGANYAELAPTATSAPIEEYAIRTWYSSYPKASYHNLSYETAIPAADSSYWHKFENRTGNFKNDDSVNGIMSYVEDNNLIIELPQRNTSPVSVVLKDACGNLNSIVLGLHDDGTANHDMIAPSFILDDHLGYAATDANGEVVTPIVIQNPYMTSGAGESEGPAWGNEGRYKWNNQSGNAGGEPAGEHQHFGFFRDDVKKATYYNPDLFSPQTFKIGFTLRFGSTYQSSTNPESVTFAAKQKAPDADVAVGKYTARALLYCTQSSTKPSKQDILDCYNSEFGSGGERTGRITEWTYVQAGNTESEVQMLLDYPKPDYTKLTGWTLKNSNGEPEPYYIWYLYEDRIGNYEIAKLVNSGALGNDLKGTKAGMYDRWFYDGDGPKITVRSTGADPKELNATQTAVDTLVAKNNGYVPYLKPSSNIVYVRSGYGEALRASNLKNTNLGWGTTHHVENSASTQYYRIYEPFMDLEVSERTGIRAFAWSTTGTAPGYSIDGTTVLSNNNTQGDHGEWYAGFDATALHADIGCGHTYTGDTTNPYFSFTDSSSSYKGVYSGTKINTVIPAGLLSTSEARPLYLHVMDWTGNITTVRMGENLTFIKDTDHPAQKFRESGVIDKTRSVDGEYYVSSEHYTGTGSFGWENKNNIWVRIAGKGDKAKNHDTIKVRIPAEFFADGTGSGNKGFGTSETDITTVNSDAEGPYLEFDYETYSKWPSGTLPEEGTPVEFYFYDNVGNQDWWKVICCFDTEAPALNSISFVTEAGKNTEFLHEDTVTDPINEVSGFGKVTNYHIRTTATKHDDISHFGTDEVQEIYVNKQGTSRFHVNFVAAVPDLADIKVNKWNATTSKWDTVTSFKSNSTEWESSNDSNGIHRYYTMVPYDKLTYSAEGTYYQIVATDKSSNANYQYFKIYLDNQAPAFTPTVTVTKGSVNKIPSASASDPVKYAYYADNDYPLTVKFTAQDTGIGRINHTYEYSYNKTQWNEFDGSEEQSLPFKTQAVPSTIYLKDKLGNVTATAPKFTYTNGSTTVNDIDELVNYYDVVVSSPSINHITDIQTKGSYGYSVNNVEKFTNNNLIVIKKDDRTGVKFTITPPDTDEGKKILGYIDSDYVNTLGAYSLINLEDANSPVKRTFEYALPMSGTHLSTDVEKTYYAVDYAGMKCTGNGLTVKFTYNNPKAARDLEFVPADSTIVTENASLKTKLGTKVLTSTFRSGNNLYYKDGWVLLRCTLYSADDDKENPKTLKLWYQNGNSWTQCGEFKTSDNTLARYNLSEAAGTRYYSYLAFQLGEAQHNKNLYCTIESTESETRRLPLFSGTETGITWIRDNAGPAIDSSKWKTENNDGCYEGTTEKIKKFYLYNAQKADGTEITDNLPLASDSQIGPGYSSIKYEHGMKIIVPKSWISDTSGLSKYQLLTVQETPAKPGDKSFTKTPGDTWTDVPDGDNLVLELPDITTTHTHIALFLQDALGNYDVYYIGNVKLHYHQWWILDKAIPASDITTTVSPTSWASGTSDYTVTVNIPVGSIVYSIGADNANVKSYHFESYTPVLNNNSHEDKQPSSTELANGWINVDKLTLVLDGITPDWGAKDVKIKINGVAQAGKVFEVPAKTIAAGDITLGQATATETTGTYTISLICDDGAKSQIASVTATGLGTGGEATLSNDKTIITLTGVPAADWNDNHEITLTIKTDKNDDLNMGKVLTVDKKTLSSENFRTNVTVHPLDTATNTCTVTFKDGEGIPADIINANGHKLLSNGSEVTGANVTYSSSDKKFTISGIPAANFTGQLNITLQVSTSDSDGTFDGGIIHTVSAKTAADLSDFEFTNVSTWNDNLYSASFKLTIKTPGLSLKTEGLEEGTHTLDTSVGSINYSGGQGNINGNGEKLPQNLAITIRTNHGNVIWKPWQTSNPSISGTGKLGILPTGLTSLGSSDTGNSSSSRIVQFINTVTDTFSTDSDFTADSSVTEKPAKKVKKAAKEAKKQAKKASAKVVSTGSTTAGAGVTAGKPVMAVEAAEILDQTLTSAVPELTAASESVVSEIAGVTEKAAGKSEVIATVEANEKMDSTGSTTEEAEQASAEEGSRSPSKSASIVIMLAILSSFSAVWYLQRNRKK